MDLTVELYWSFRSPYSYVVLPRIAALRDEYRVTIDMRIVHPNAIRNPSYFARMDPLARPYFLKDSARVAAFHGMRLRRPVPDPIDQDQGTHLAQTAARAGLDLAELEAAVTADPQRYEARLAENDRALRAAGHWGVPTMVFEGEPLFGQDRFDVLLWRMKQRGLEARPPAPASR